MLFWCLGNKTELCVSCCKTLWVKSVVDNISIDVAYFKAHVGHWARANRVPCIWKPAFENLPVTVPSSCIAPTSF